MVLGHLEKTKKHERRGASLEVENEEIQSTLSKRHVIIRPSWFWFVATCVFAGLFGWSFDQWKLENSRALEVVCQNRQLRVDGPFNNTRHCRLVLHQGKLYARGDGQCSNLCDAKHFANSPMFEADGGRRLASSCAEQCGPENKTKCVQYCQDFVCDQFPCPSMLMQSQANTFCAGYSLSYGAGYEEGCNAAYVVSIQVGACGSGMTTT